MDWRLAWGRAEMSGMGEQRWVQVDEWHRGCRCASGMGKSTDGCRRISGMER